MQMQRSVRTPSRTSVRYLASATGLLLVLPLMVTTSAPAIAATACAAIPDGLVSWWRAEGNASDAWGSNDGVLTNGASIASTGKVGTAFQFDGVNDHVLIPDSESLKFNNTTSFTIELWWNRSVNNLPFHALGKRPSCSPPPYYQVGIDSSFPASIRSLGTWIHVAVVYNVADNLEHFYVNGTEVKALPRRDTSPTIADLLIGGSGSCAHFGGLVDEVSIYNRALAASEIQAIFNADSLGKCLPPPPSPCFESGAGATYLKVCVSGDGTLEEFQSPAGYQQLPVAADNKEGYALCSGTRVLGYDAGLDESGFGPATIIQPGGVGTFPLSIVRTTTDGVFQLTQAFTRDTGEKDFTVAMTVKNLSAASVSAVKLTRYFNGDIDNTGADDLYDRTLDTVWGTQGPAGHGLGLFAKSGNAHALRIEDATAWDPQGGGGAERCDVTGVTPAVPDDYAGRITYSLYSIAPSASKTVSIVYRRQ